MELNKYIDHTILKADASNLEIKKICNEAKDFNFASVCVNPVNVKLVKNELKNSSINTCSVLGFPLGANTEKTKIYEAKECINNGADEIDMVINVSALKNKEFDKLFSEINLIKTVCDHRILKVIIETCYLIDEDIENICKIAVEAKADFVKTSTGFGPSGATFKDVKFMKSIVGNRAKVKASGGIRDYDTARAFIDLGASRLGTSSGIAIVKEEVSDEKSY